MKIAALIGLLLFLLGALAFVLFNDAKARRINAQLDVALPPRAADEPGPRSVWTAQQSRVGRLLQLLFRYDGRQRWSWLVVAAGIVAGIASAVVGQILIPLWLSVIGGAIAGSFVVRGLFGRQRDRYADRMLRQLPDTMQLIIGAVRTGLPVNEAFRAVAREMPEPTRGQFEIVNNDTALGHPADEAMRGIFYRTRVAEYAMFSVALAVQSKSGGHLAETLQVLADAVRERVALAGRARALAADARLSMRVMSTLPFVAGTMLYIENPASMNGLFDDHRGRILAAVAITLLTAGVLSMRHLIKRGTTV